MFILFVTHAKPEDVKSEDLGAPCPSTRYTAYEEHACAQIINDAMRAGMQQPEFCTEIDVAHRKTGWRILWIKPQGETCFSRYNMAVQSETIYEQLRGFMEHYLPQGG